MTDKQMGLLDHIAELRMRIFLVAIFFVCAFIAGMLIAKPLIVYLAHVPAEHYFSVLSFFGHQAPEHSDFKLNAFRITDPMFIYLEFACLVAFVLTAPLLLYQLWAFVRPGLYKNERRITLIYIPFVVIMFLFGVCFAYFLLFPYILRFMFNLSNTLGIQETIGIHQYFTFLFELTITFGFVFQLPLLSVFLTRLGLITPRWLGKIRKYAYFVLLVVAGLITPPDVISQLIAMVPLVALYELSILFSRLAYRKARRAQAMDSYV